MKITKVMNWNLQWTGPGEKRAANVMRHFSSQTPDVACFTEIQQRTLPAAGFSLLSNADHGYKKPPGYHKAALWSRETWTERDESGPAEMPSGRFVSGVTQGIRFVGVCIPWKAAHVGSGKRNKVVWEDHLQFLRALYPVIEGYLRAPEPVCLLGDFNQRIPRHQQPVEVYSALEAVLALGLRPLTAGVLDEEKSH